MLSNVPPHPPLQLGIGSPARAVLQVGMERMSGSSPWQLGDPQAGLQSRLFFCAQLFRDRHGRDTEPHFSSRQGTVGWLHGQFCSSQNT